MKVMNYYYVRGKGLQGFYKGLQGFYKTNGVLK